MIALTLSILLSQAATPAQVQSPSSLITKMFAKYAGAETMLGKIRLTQTAGQASVTIDTEVQYAKPAKLYIKQSKSGSQPKMWLVTSDGNQFSYDRPEGLPVGINPPRFVENVHVKDEVIDLKVQRDIRLTNQDIYVAARKSLGDRNLALDVVIGRTDDLRELAGQWAKFGNYGKVKINDVQVNKIGGDYIGIYGQPASGTFELYITDDGDLIRYVTRQKMKFPEATQETFEIVSTWDSVLLVNAKVNPQFFEVVRASK